MSGQRNFAWIEGGVECRWNAAADLSGSTGQRRPCGNRTDSCSSGKRQAFFGHPQEHVRQSQAPQQFAFAAFSKVVFFKFVIVLSPFVQRLTRFQRG